MSKKQQKPQGSFFRTCNGCGKVRNKFELLRIARTPEGSVVFDVTGKHPGRGAYVCNDRTCIEKALRSGKLSRTLKAGIPEGILDEYGK